MAELSKSKPLDAIIQTIETETGLITDLLPDGEEHQWSAAPRRRSASALRATAGSVPDPTADIALDDRRLALREATTRARERLGSVWRLAVELRGARRALEQALKDYGLDVGVQVDEYLEVK